MTKHSRVASRVEPAGAGLAPLAAGIALLIFSVLMLSGCNTTAGAGQDINATGAAITRGADSVKSKL